MISTSALCASSTLQCGVGWVSGTPGARTSAATVDQSSARKSCVAMPAACASATDLSLSSKATTSAPPACSALADNRPERASPKTATFLPAKVVIGIKDYLSLSEARPASASTTATIQKRITICGSVQPSCS